jgi:A/G-specific adenine glycosylase
VGRSSGETPKPNFLNLRGALLHWGQQNFRAYPWRLTRDPYRILIAEVMLHRTRASQVVPIYEQFVRRYSNARALHLAKPQDLYGLLRPLGLRWRIKLIREMAKDLVQKFDGRIPRDLDTLKSLPGVSDYIAGAVRCFAWNEPEVLLDTNTVRVASRFFGVPARDSSRRSRVFKDLLRQLLDPQHPRAFNLALLDLADALCTAKRPPVISICPLSSWCVHALQSRPTDDSKEYVHREGQRR